MEEIKFSVTPITERVTMLIEMIGTPQENICLIQCLQETVLSDNGKELTNPMVTNRILPDNFSLESYQKEAAWKALCWRIGLDSKKDIERYTKERSMFNQWWDANYPVK